jgi:hypothetical protein
MRIPLSEFEQYVRPEPLERGLAIFERGGVESIRNLGKGTVEAVVHDGGAIWHPQLTLKDEVATDAVCECGEAPDSICRHGLALIFALQSGEFPEGITTRSGKLPKEKMPAKGRGRPKIEDAEAAPKPKKPAAPKKPKIPKTPADILAIVPHEELVAFVLAQCNYDKDFAIRLKAHFSDLLPATSSAEIKKRIQEMVKAAITVKGKTKKLNQPQLFARVKEWLQEGERFAEIHEYQLSFAVAEHLSAELGDLLSHSQFVSEELEALKTQAQELMLRLANHPLPESVRVEFLQHAKASWEKIYHVITPSILLASKICKIGEECASIENMFQSMLRNYDESYIEHHWNMVKRVKGEAAGEAFKKKYADTVYFINAEIDEALAVKDYETAIRAARKGQAKYFSYADDKVLWIERLDAIYEAKGDNEARIALAISAYQENITSDRVSLKNIAALGGQARWITERNRLADPIAVKQHPDPYRLASLFEIDNDWDGMLEFLKRYKVNRIVLLGKVLVKEVPEKFAALLQSQLEEAFKTKNRMTEWELQHVAVAMARCIGKDATLAFFKAFSERIANSHVLASFMTHIDRNLAYASYSYW